MVAGRKAAIRLQRPASPRGDWRRRTHLGAVSAPLFPAGRRPCHPQGPAQARRVQGTEAGSPEGSSPCPAAGPGHGCGSCCHTPMAGARAPGTWRRGLGPTSDHPAARCPPRCWGWGVRVHPAGKPKARLQANGRPPSKHADRSDRPRCLTRRPRRPRGSGRETGTGPSVRVRAPRLRLSRDSNAAADTRLAATLTRHRPA